MFVVPGSLNSSIVWTRRRPNIFPVNLCAREERLERWLTSRELMRWLIFEAIEFFNFFMFLEWFWVLFSSFPAEKENKALKMGTKIEVGCSKVIILFSLFFSSPEIVISLAVNLSTLSKSVDDNLQPRTVWKATAQEEAAVVELI